MGKIFKHLCVLALLIMLMRSPEALAAASDNAGTVLAARRTAWSDRSKNELVSKNPIYTGDLLTTNTVGRLQVLFRDDSILMMAPDTQTRITEYLYGSEAGGGISLELARGVTRIISGKVTEEGGMINVSTPDAEVGIRGTDVLVDTTPGYTRIAVLQGSEGRPTRVCLPGQTDCVELGHRQGIVITGQKWDRMNSGDFNTFSRASNPNRENGVKTALYAPPPPASAPGGVSNPGGTQPGSNPGGAIPPGGPENPATPPEVPGGAITASYSGTFAHTGGYGYATGLPFEGSFNFTVKDLNTSSPMLSSVNFYGQLVDSGTTYEFRTTGSGNLATVTNETDFSFVSSGDSPLKTTTIKNGGIGTSGTGVANSDGGTLYWNVSGGDLPGEIETTGTIVAD